MKNLICVLAASASSFFLIPAAAAEILTFSVSVDKGAYALGESVNWTLFATASDSTANNFGIATISADLTDSFGNALTPGTIGAPFTDYDGPPSGGTLNVGTGGLEAIGAVLFGYDAVKVEADNVGALGPLLLASGSYTPTNVGFHTLAVSPTGDVPGPNNEFFTSAASTTAAYTFGSHVDASFTVTAVPEPGTFLFLLCAGGLFALRRIRSQKARG